MKINILENNTKWTDYDAHTILHSSDQFLSSCLQLEMNPSISGTAKYYILFLSSVEMFRLNTGQTVTAVF